jgi:hypothetical protein
LDRNILLLGTQRLVYEFLHTLGILHLLLLFVTEDGDRAPKHVFQLKTLLIILRFVMANACIINTFHKKLSGGKAPCIHTQVSGQLHASVILTQQTGIYKSHG